MIKLDHVKKQFGDIIAVNNITLGIEENQVFGMVGTNGAGKSTLLRMMAGVLRPDSGSIMIDDREVYDNPEAKLDMFFISDEPYFFSNSSANDMRDYFRTIYPGYETERFNKLMKDFGLDPKRRIARYSKGMKKQLAIIEGICANTKYLFLDETFDGLDPVMRQSAKSLFANDMDERGLTPVIASHNLRELEDICDHVGLLHKGGLLLDRDLADLKLGVLKVQCVFKDEAGAGAVLGNFKVLNHEKQGRLHVLVIAGSREEIEPVFRTAALDFFEVLPLSLEEIFISETEVAGYDVRKLIVG